MAIVNININCGCGFHAQTIEEAAEHADEKKHSLDIFGSVKPSGHEVLGASIPVGRRSRKPSTTVALSQMQSESVIDFGKLRARIQRR